MQRAQHVHSLSHFTLKQQVSLTLLSAEPQEGELKGIMFSCFSFSSLLAPLPAEHRHHLLDDVRHPHCLMTRMNLSAACVCVLRDETTGNNETNVTIIFKQSTIVATEFCLSHRGAEVNASGQSCSLVLFYKSNVTGTRLKQRVH